MIKELLIRSDNVFLKSNKNLSETSLFEGMTDIPIAKGVSLEKIVQHWREGKKQGELQSLE